MPHPATFPELIESLGDHEPARGLRLIDKRFRETFYPYGDLLRRVKAAARQFQEHGVRQGDRVLLSLPTELGPIVSFLALQYLGAVPFSIPSPMMGQDREAHRHRVLTLMGSHRIDWLLASRDLEGVAGDCEEGSRSIELAIPDMSKQEIKEEVTVQSAEVGEDELAFVQFSSGSTSDPKGVQITHRNLIYNLRLIVANDQRTTESVWVSWLPLYHDMGLVGGFLTNLLAGNDVILMNPVCFLVRPLSWLEAISRYRGTVSAIPNFTLDMCTDRIPEERLKNAGLDLSSFRYVYNGAEPVDVGSIRRFEERFGPHGMQPGCIYPVYGMAEATLIITAPDREKSLRAIEWEGRTVPSVGRPLGDFELELRDEEGKPLGPGSSGQIWVRGTSVTPGYYPIPGRESSGLEDGWLPTGDLAVLDEEGRVYITGREKDIIIYKGRNFYGHDIAAALGKLPWVPRRKVFVFQIQIGDAERIVVLVGPLVPTEGGPADEESYKDAICREVLSQTGLPVYDVCVVPNIPKTTSGKVRRHVCHEIYTSHAEESSSAD